MAPFKTLCVFCGSRLGDDPDHAEAGRALAREIARRKIHLIYGGGDIGLMSVVARAVLEEGGTVTSVIPGFLQEYEVGDPGCQEIIVTEGMHERKRIMFERADGFVILPGGLGTLDELVEITTWKQLQQHEKPIVVVDVNGYWKVFKDAIDAIVDGGYGHHDVANLFTMVPNVDAVFEALKNAPAPHEEILTSHL